MVIKNVYERTFFIKAAAYGTAFAIDVGEHEFIVTAAHLLPPKGASLYLRVNLHNQWLDFEATEVGRCAGEIDIAVLKLPQRLAPDGYPVVTGSARLTLGQDIYFLGFPYKLSGDFGFLQTGGPLAYVKRGTVSLLEGPDRPGFTIDGVNNEGFSGGPVVFYPPGNPTEVKIAAVVAKFRTETEDVLDEHGEPTGHKVPYNTGFMTAYGIGHALELITRYLTK